MTTTFHFEPNDPQYEFSCEGVDVQLRCQGLVSVAAGPPPALGEKVLRTWFELSPASEPNTGRGWAECPRNHRYISGPNERDDMGECHGGPCPTRARRNKRCRC